MPVSWLCTVSLADCGMWRVVKWQLKAVGSPGSWLNSIPHNASQQHGCAESLGDRCSTHSHDTLAQSITCQSLPISKCIFVLPHSSPRKPPSSVSVHDSRASASQVKRKRNHTYTGWRKKGKCVRRLDEIETVEGAISNRFVAVVNVSLVYFVI